MSKYYVEKIACPKCGKESDFIIWQSINTMLDPEMKEKVRTKEAFTFECPDCGNKTMVIYPWLYHQMEDKMMIYCVCDKGGYDKVFNMFNRESDSEEVVMNILNDDYLLRIAVTLNGLQEKLLIFDNGLDDRVIELAKLFVLNHAGEEGLEPQDILFDINQEENYCFRLFDDKEKCLGTVDFSKDFYEFLVKEYLEDAPDIRKDRFDIDMKWALEIIEKHHRE